MFPALSNYLDPVSLRERSFQTLPVEFTPTTTFPTPKPTYYSTAMAATTAIPAGGTWFNTLKKSFVDVPVDAAHGNAIATTDFLDAADSLTTLFGTSK